MEIVKSLSIALMSEKVITELLCPIAGAAGNYIKDSIEFKSLENTINKKIELLEKTRKTLISKGFDENLINAPNNFISLKSLAHLLDNYRYEDNEILKTMYSNLLANSIISDRDIEINYLHTLSSMSSSDVLIFNKIYSDLPNFNECKHKKIITIDLPKKIKIVDEIETSTDVLDFNVESILANLHKLGCLNPIKSWGGGESFEFINVTVFGYHLFKACN